MSGIPKINIDGTLYEFRDGSKVPLPDQNPNGTAGRFLRSKGDGTTEWAEAGAPTNEQVNSAVFNWLNDHPEATAVGDRAHTIAVNTAIKQFMTSVKTLLGDLVYTKENHAGASVSSAAEAVIAAIDSGEVLETYSIIKSLTNCTISNAAATALENSSYSATITLAANATMSSVMISMGGTDITSTAWNAQTGAISIPSVTGNIIISCIATVDEQGDDPGEGGDTPTMVETMLFANKSADGSTWSMKNVPVTFANGDYFEASINCTNVDDSGSGTHVFTIGETGQIGYGSHCNAVTVFWRSGKALCRYKTAGGNYTEATKDEWVTVSNKQFTVSLDKDGFKVNGNLAISASLMPQLMAFSAFEVGSTSSSNTAAFYSYIKVFNLVSADNTFLYRNYRATGVFSTENVNLDLANGDYVETWIDCTGLASGTCIFTIGENGKTVDGSDMNAIRVIYNGSGSAYSIQYRVNGGAYTTVSIDATTVKYNQVMLRLDADGFKANGDAVSSVKVAAADMGQTIGVTNWEIGSAATPATSAWYPRILAHHEAAAA